MHCCHFFHGSFHPLALVQVNSPSLMRAGSVEQYKRAFARQRARDLAHHADALLSKDKEIAALQQDCRDLEARLGTAKVRLTTVFWSYCASLHAPLQSRTEQGLPLLDNIGTRHSVPCVTLLIKAASLL